MRRTAHTFAHAALALALVACAPPPTQEAAADPRAGVRQLLQRLAADSAAGDFDALKALFANDPAFYWVEQGRVAYPDYGAAIAGIDKTATLQPKIASVVEGITVTPLGAAAAAFRADVDMAFQSERVSFEVDGVITGVAVWRDNRWQFLQAHLSSPK